MAKNSYAKTSLSPAHIRILRNLGERIHFARKRRGMTLTELANRMMTTVKTAQRLEKGDVGISLGVLLTALVCMGIEKDMEKVAAMETDAIALAHDRRRLLTKKSRQPANSEERFFEGL